VREEEEAERRILADSSHKTMKTPTITSSYKNLRSLSESFGEGRIRIRVFVIHLLKAFWSVKAKIFLQRSFSLPELVCVDNLRSVFGEEELGFL
jgi:hypothetical protein